MGSVVVVSLGFAFLGLGGFFGFYVPWSKGRTQPVFSEEYWKLRS